MFAPTHGAAAERHLVFSQPGTLNATGLEELIPDVKNLDMDKLPGCLGRAAPVTPHEKTPSQLSILLDTPRGIRIGDARARRNFPS